MVGRVGKKRVRGSWVGILGFIALALQIPTYAQTGKNVPRNPDVVQSQGASAEDAVASMLVSHPYASSFDSDYVKTGVDLLEYHIQELKALENGGKGHPLIPQPLPKGAKLKKVFAYYGMGSDRLAEAILHAKKQGLEIEMMVDLNRSLKGDFSAGAARSVDFNQATFLDTEDGRALQKFLKSGFRINAEHGPYRVLSQPLFNPALVQRIPIFHLKESYTVLVHEDGREEALYMTAGTANMNQDVPRYNRMYVIRDPDLCKYGYEHYKRMADVFDSNGAIADVEPMKPLEVQYKDGTSIRSEYTDGRFNLNNNAAHLLDTIAKDPEHSRLDDVMFSEFVYTYGKYHQALSDAMDASPKATFWGIGDQKFLSDSQWGLFRAFEGIGVYRPRGPPVPPLKRDQRWMKDDQGVWKKRVDFYGWMSVVKGKVIKDLDGIPHSIELWHDKTNRIRYERDQKVWNALSTGSFNLSGNFKNMESQFFMKLGADSRLARAVEESVRKVIDKNPDHAIPGEDVFLLEELGRFLGIGYNHVEAQRSREWLKLIQAGSLDIAKGYLLSIGRGHTELTDKLTGESLEGRIDRLFGFLNWYKTLADQRQAKLEQAGQKFERESLFASRINGRTLPVLLKTIWDPHLQDSNIRFILGGLTWMMGDADPNDKEALKADNERLKPLAWDALGMKAPFRPPVNENRPRAVDDEPEDGLTTLQVRFFDIDDTLFHLDTPIIVYKRSDPKIEKEISSEEFARERKAMQTSGSEWMLDGKGPNGGSYRHFRDDPDVSKRSRFEDDLEKILSSSNPQAHFAAKLEDLVKQLSTEEGARFTYFVTARGHHPEVIVRGLARFAEWVQKNRGLKLYLPPAQNVLPLSHASFENHPETRQPFQLEEGKAYYMFQKLLDVNAFIAQNHKRGKAIAGFMDDDRNNVLGALQSFVKEKQAPGVDPLANVNLFVEHVMKNGKFTRYKVLTNGDVTYEESEGDLIPVRAADTGVKVADVLSGKETQPEASQPESCSDLLVVKKE